MSRLPGARSTQRRDPPPDQPIRGTDLPFASSNTPRQLTIDSKLTNTTPVREQSQGNEVLDGHPAIQQNLEEAKLPTGEHATLPIGLRSSQDECSATELPRQLSWLGWS